MKTYRELVKECPELGEAFAEFENRISYLENKLPYHEEAAKEAIEEPVTEGRWVSKQWDVVNQLRSMVLYLQEKVNKSTDKKKRTKLTIK